MSRSNGKSPFGEGPDEDPPRPPDFDEPPQEPKKKRKRKPKTAPIIASQALPPGDAPGPRTATSEGWPIWLVPLPMVGGIVLLAVFVWLGGFIPPPEAPTLALDRIQIDLPHHLSHRKFIEEVQYLGNLPATINPQSQEDLFRLRAALEKHPWVRSVELIEPRGQGLEVEILVRKPVMLVPVPPTSSAGGKPRMVDEAGVLLPIGDPQPLPVLEVTVPPPAGEPGQLWGHPTVEKASAMAGWFSRREPPIHLEAIRGEPGKWILSLDQRWVLWHEGLESLGQQRMVQKLIRARTALARTSRGGTVDLNDPTLGP